jgi:hypothetical protein
MTVEEVEAVLSQHIISLPEKREGTCCGFVHDPNKQTCDYTKQIAETFGYIEFIKPKELCSNNEQSNIQAN